ARRRLLPVRAGQLAHPHLSRVLAALVVRLALGARALAGALVAAAGSLARAGALTAPDALARLARAGLRPDRVETDLLGSEPGHHEASPSSTTTRWSTTLSMPRSCGVSSSALSRPILPSRSERSVSRCLALAPFA